jgi:hypothetical protein
MPVVVPGDYWLVPGAGHLCIINQTPASPGVGAVCATTAHVVGHGMATVAIPRSSDLTPTGASRLIVGIAPDRARRVSVHTRHRVATVPVVDGLFVRRDATMVPPDCRVAAQGVEGEPRCPRLEVDFRPRSGAGRVLGSRRRAPEVLGRR